MDKMKKEGKLDIQSHIRYATNLFDRSTDETLGNSEIWTLRSIAISVLGILHFLDEVFEGDGK